MFKKKALLSLSLSVCISLGMSPHALADAVVGEQAPEFTAKDSTGKEHSLKDLKGKTFILEWFNPGCPFVKKFYSRGDMQKFQEELAARGVTWLTVSSSARGKQGHLTPEAAEDVRKELGMKSTALLLDSDGSVGRAFGAKTTPHIFIINAQGKVAYAGAVDSVASTDSDDIKGATNYVYAAIDALNSGKTVEPASTQPYGCAVKY